MIFEQLFFPLTGAVTSLFYIFHMFLCHNLLVYSLNHEDIGC